MKVLTKTLLLVATLTLFTAYAAADDDTLIGNWIFTIDLGNGVVTANATFTVEEGVVRGTMNAPSGQLSITGGGGPESVRIYGEDAAGLLYTFDGVRAGAVMSGRIEIAGETVGIWSASLQ